MTGVVIQPQRCANCDEPMDMEKVVWWCEGGVCCKEACAREFTKTTTLGPA